MCPELQKRREYLIVGYEDLATQRLLFLDNCVSVKWKNKLDKRIRVSLNFYAVQGGTFISYTISYILATYKPTSTNFKTQLQVDAFLCPRR